MADIEVDKDSAFEAALISFMDAEYGDTRKQVSESGDWNDELGAVFKEALEKFKSTQTW